MVSLKASGRVLGCLLGMASAGCAGAPEPLGGGDSDGSETIAGETEEVGGCSSCGYQTISVSSGSTITNLPRASYMCWPTRYGRSSSGPTPNFTVDDQDGIWRLTGSGTATCVRRCCFHSEEPGFTRSLSVAVTTQVTADSSINYFPNSASLGSPGGMPFLNGIVHQPSGMLSSDYARVKLNPLSVEVVGACNVGFFCALLPPTLAATGYDLQIGGPSHFVRKLTKTLTQASPEGIFLPPNVGACTITNLQGALSGTTDAVELLWENANYWHGGIGTGVSSAEITCYHFDQNP